MVVNMKVSTKGRYALRLMLDLAVNDQKEPIRLKEVAERQQISEKYLEQIISVLQKCGYVRSLRGPGGGYTSPPALLGVTAQYQWKSSLVYAIMKSQ